MLQHPPPVPVPVPVDVQAHLHAQARARSYSVCTLCTVTAAVFFLTGVTPLPVLLYFPLSRRFGFQGAQGGPPAELTMDWYGRSLLALLAGAAAGLSIYAVLHLLRRARPTA